MVIIVRQMIDNRKGRSADQFQPQPRPHKAERTTAEALLGPARELIIEHDGRDYRLRITQQGRLILTA